MFQTHFISNNCIFFMSFNFCYQQRGKQSLFSCLSEVKPELLINFILWPSDLHVRNYTCTDEFSLKNQFLSVIIFLYTVKNFFWFSDHIFARCMYSSCILFVIFNFVFIFTAGCHSPPSFLPLPQALTLNFLRLSRMLDRILTL